MLPTPAHRLHAGVGRELFVQAAGIEHSVDDGAQDRDEPGDEHEQHTGHQARQIGGDLFDQDRMALRRASIERIERADQRDQDDQPEDDGGNHRLQIELLLGGIGDPLFRRAAASSRRIPARAKTATIQPMMRMTIAPRMRGASAPKAVPSELPIAEKSMVPPYENVTSD
jgi:hypothetical protein